MEETKDLLRLDTRDIVNPAVASSVCCAEENGIEQFKKFVADRLVEWSMPISEHIMKNKFLLFSSPPPPTKSNTNLQISSLKNDVSLLSKLYIACQSRDGNLDESSVIRPSMSSFTITSWKAKAGKQIRPLALPGDGCAILKSLTENTFDE